MPVSISGSGSITGVSTLTQLTSLDVTGEVSIGGTLTYDDVTNIDSIGIITARGGVVGDLTGDVNAGLVTASSGIHVTGGNVGIGTDESYGDGNASFSSLSLGGNGTRFGLLEINKSDGTAGSWIDCYGTGGNGDLRITTAGTSGKITFWTGGEFTEKVTIASNGSVGIGTTSTDRVLAVYGNGNLGTQLALVSPGTQAAGLSIEGDRRYEIQSTSTIYTHPSSLIFYDRGANALRMKIDESGRVSKPYQLWIAGSPTNTGGSGIANSFDTSSFANPVGLSFDTSNGNNRITVPIAGVYMITFNTICDITSSRKDAQIRINGSTIVNTLSEDSTTGYHYRSASIAIKLAASDYIQFANNDWYDSTTTDSEWRTASVYLLG